MHDRYPDLDSTGAPESPQLTPNPEDPAEATMAEYYARDTPDEPLQELPEPVVPLQRETGQLTSSMMERPEIQGALPINEGRFGFRALHTTVRHMRRG